MKILKMLVFIIFTTNLTAQIDTTVWYPMHVGDKWEYYGQSYGSSQVKIIGDTLMPNGNIYYMFSGGVYAWRFQRKQNKDLVYYYNTADKTEHLLFDFGIKDKSLWDVPFGHYWGIFETNTDNQNLLNLQLTYKIFNHALIDSTTIPPDTNWGYLIDAYPTHITKGFGVTSYSYGLKSLMGVVINGVGYGTLVGVDENTSIVNGFKLHQNYPNPFNPSTTIKYEIPLDIKRETKNKFIPSGVEGEHVTLKVYNVLGREVTTLVSKKQNPGNYNVTFDASSLPSGIYFYRLQIGEFSQVNKMLLLK